MIKLGAQFKTMGLFRLIVRRWDGAIRVDTGWFRNMILDAGLNRMGSGYIMTHAQVGSGTTPPVVANTSLETWVASTNLIQASVSACASSPQYYGYQRTTYRFTAGVAAGICQRSVLVGQWRTATSSPGRSSRTRTVTTPPSQSSTTKSLTWCTNCDRTFLSETLVHTTSIFLV